MLTIKIQILILKEILLKLFYKNIQWKTITNLTDSGIALQVVLQLPWQLGPGLPSPSNGLLNTTSHDCIA